MKKVVLIILLLLSLALTACAPEPSAEAMLRDFLYTYGAEGVVYSSEAAEGEEGYVYDGLVEKIFIFEGDFPKNYAIFLNSHADGVSECGVFVCDDGDERERVTDMCERRIRLLDSSEGFISRSGNIVFYSTLTDKHLTLNIWKKIIRAHT